jgi:histidinol-phosphate aminotransferase
MNESAMPPPDTHAAGLLLRDLRAAPGLSQALRITIGSPEQNDQLLASLQ